MPRKAVAWRRAGSGWLWRRLDRKRPDGLLMTVGLLTAAVLTVGFLNLAADVLLHDEIVSFDQVVMQLVYDFRSSALTVYFIFVTNLAGVEALLAGLVAMAVYARRTQLRVLPAVFGLALLTGLAVTQFLKLVFGRLRPEEALQLVVEHGFSFPSGHTFMAALLFGLGGYVGARMSRSSGRRLAIGLGVAWMIGLVAVSRVYLGVHYPSDVLASLLLASAFLCLAITGLETNQRFRLRPAYLLPANPGSSLMVGSVAAAVASVWLTFGG